MKNIKIFITDCDGVLTDAGMYYFSNGLEAKKFNTRDGMAFSILRKKEIIIGIITGEDNDIIKNRAKKLNMDFLYTGVSVKENLLDEICKKYSVNKKNILYVGDDLNDLEIMKNVGYSCCPADACQEIKEIANYTCIKSGGDGVIREIVDNFFLGGSYEKR